MPNFELHVAMGTHTGHIRDHNEDAVGYHYPSDFDTLSEKGVLLVLADGVGGLPEGEKASQFAIERVIDLYYDAPQAMSTRDALVDSIKQINAEVFRDFEERSATTLVAVVIQQSEVTVAYVGDSRLYWFDGHSVQLYTQDHVVEVHEEGKRPKKRLTRAIGHQANIQVDVLTDRISSGEGLLLVSDGAAPYLNLTDLLTLSRENPREMVADIITHSLQGGGHDNISAVWVSVGELLSDSQSLKHHLQHLTSEGVSVYIADTLKNPLRNSVLRQIRWGIFLLLMILLIGVITSLLLFINEANQAQSANNTQIPLVATLESGGDIATDTLLTGQNVIFDTVALTYTQTNHATSAFLIVPNTVYQVISTSIDENEQVWYQIYDEETDQHGWIIEADLPPYTTSD